MRTGKVKVLLPRWIAPMRAVVEEKVARVDTPEILRQNWNGETIAAAMNLAANTSAIPNWIRQRHPHVVRDTSEIIDQCIKEGCDRFQTSYILATARHESVLGLYMTELGRDVGLKYEGRKSLGNNVKGDGPRFIGRGFVQLTGRRNYTYWMKRLQLPLLSNPNLVSDTTVAAEILVKGMMGGHFTGRKLTNYVGKGNKFIDYVGARRTVNGLDKAEEIAEYAFHYEKFFAPYFNED